MARPPLNSRLWEAVVERDARFLWGLIDGTGLYSVWRRQQRLICMVPLLEPDNRHRCGGRQTVDHVKDAPRLGKRAPDDAKHLVAMCYVHNVWYPPSRALRQAQREYLSRYWVTGLSEDEST